MNPRICHSCSGAPPLTPKCTHTHTCTHGGLGEGSLTQLRGPMKTSDSWAPPHWSFPATPDTVQGHPTAKPRGGSGASDFWDAGSETNICFGGCGRIQRLHPQTDDLQWKRGSPSPWPALGAPRLVSPPCLAPPAEGREASSLSPGTAAAPQLQPWPCPGAGPACCPPVGHSTYPVALCYSAWGALSSWLPAKRCTGRTVES